MELIEVALVKTSFFIQGIMKFIAGNACVTTLIQVNYKAIQQVKKTVFLLMLVLAIQPKNLVAPGALIRMVYILIADSGSVEMLAGVQVDQMCF